MLWLQITWRIASKYSEKYHVSNGKINGFPLRGCSHRSPRRSKTFFISTISSLSQEQATLGWHCIHACSSFMFRGPGRSIIILQKLIKIPFRDLHLQELKVGQRTLDVRTSRLSMASFNLLNVSPPRGFVWLTPDEQVTPCDVSMCSWFLCSSSSMEKGLERQTKHLAKIRKVFGPIGSFYQGCFQRERKHVFDVFSPGSICKWLFFRSMHNRHVWEAEEKTYERQASSNSDEINDNGVTPCFNKSC